jgi:TalC/MipB family fructose-6-phosphate aldolase
MQIWLDSVDISLIQQISKMGILYGVTTNPSLIANARKNSLQTIQNILNAQIGPIAVQVVSRVNEEMLQQARQLHRLNSRIVVKVPATADGFQVIHELRKDHIATMATAVLEPNQVLLSGIAGAAYVAPYIGRISDKNEVIIKELKVMKAIIDRQNFSLQMLGASIRNTEQVSICAQLGIPAITLSSEIIRKILDIHPITKMCLDKFAADWQESRLPFP